MRIYAVTPIHVGTAELARRQKRYDGLCPPGLTVDLADLGPQAPGALETADDVRSSEDLVVEALADHPPGYDAVLPDCVLDPGVERLAGALDVPVLGLLRLSVGYQVLVGRTLGAVARNRAIADELAARVAAYGWAGSLAGVEVLDLDVHAIADPGRWSQALHGAVEALAARGVRAVVNGCSAVDVDRHAAGAPLLDPTELALRLVAAGEAA